MLRRLLIVLVCGHIKHSGYSPPGLHWRTRARVGIATLSEIAEHCGSRLFAPVRPRQSEGALPYRSRSWWTTEKTGVVVTVAPRVRPGRSDFYQSAQDRLVVVGCFFLGRQILLQGVSQEIVGDRLSWSPWRSGAGPGLLHEG